MILVRHGESEFNVHYSKTRIDPGIEDPLLTEQGHAQALEVAAKIAAEGSVKRIIASPYRRTLQTAKIIAGHLGLPVTVEQLVRERAFFACDVGSPRAELHRDFPDFHFGALAEVWWPPLDETEEQLGQRCHQFCLDAATWRDWESLLVVTHWGFIRGLTGERVANAEIRRFDPRQGPAPEPID